MADLRQRDTEEKAIEDGGRHWLMPREYWPLPEARGGKDGFSPGTSDENVALLKPHLVSDRWLPEL